MEKTIESQETCSNTNKLLISNKVLQKLNKKKTFTHTHTHPYSAQIWNTVKCYMMCAHTYIQCTQNLYSMDSIPTAWKNFHINPLHHVYEISTFIHAFVHSFIRSLSVQSPPFLIVMLQIQQIIIIDIHIQ